MIRRKWMMAAVSAAILAIFLFSYAINLTRM
jgi:predicted Co/Zn/Cd cation transporter (cation efflux family)